MTMKKVTKKEYDEFIKNFPRKLEGDVYRTPEPPLAQANDFSEGKTWPESVVAQIKLNDVIAREYFIMEAEPK